MFLSGGIDFMKTCLCHGMKEVSMRPFRVLILGTLLCLACSGPSQTSDVSDAVTADVQDVLAPEDTSGDLTADTRDDTIQDVVTGVDTAGPDTGAADVQDVTVPEDTLADAPSDAVADIPDDVPVNDDTTATDVEEDNTLPPEGACLNQSDQDLIDADETGIKTQTTTCAMDCISLPEPVTCSADCLVTNTGLSSACALCYAAEQDCMFDQCLSPCMTDPSSENCIGCQYDSGCFSSFKTCSGFEFISE